MMSRYDSSVFLLVTLLVTLTNFSQFCAGIPIDNANVSTSDHPQRPEVNIPQGRILGVGMVTRLGRDFDGFKGIPYAQPPVGNLRFKGPLPATPWNGTLDGSVESNRCPQTDGEAVIGNEDCLYLNVYTPRLPVSQNSTLLPVLIFVYGGGFQKGTNSPSRWGPQFLLDKDIVYVAPNYRTGVLGYLSTGDEIAPGNYALKDLVIVLEWVRDNIRYFGGDPNRVTIMGGSSGAISVHLLTFSDLTKGLFHGYITESGTAHTIISCPPREKFTQYTRQLGEYLHCPTNTSSVLIDCLRGLNASQLVSAKPIFEKWQKLPEIIWSPTVEPKIKGALLTDSPKKLLAAGKIRDLPWINSVTRNEGILFGAPFYDKPHDYQELFNNLDTLLPIVLQYEGLVYDETMFTNALKSYYLNNLTADADTLLTNITQLSGDLLITYPSYKGFLQHSMHATKNQYLYTFEYQGNLSYSYMFTGGSTKNWGVAHGEELLYLIPGPKDFFGPPGWEFSENDWKMVDIMVQLLTSFVIDGTPSTLDPNGTIVWEPFSSGHNYLRIGNGPNLTLELRNDFFLDRMRFWKELDAATSWRD